VILVLPSFMCNMTVTHSRPWLILMRHDSFILPHTRVWFLNCTHSCATWIIFMLHMNENGDARTIHTCEWQHAWVLTCGSQCMSHVGEYTWTMSADVDETCHMRASGMAIHKPSTHICGNINESSRTRMSHGRHGWVMSHMNTTQRATQEFHTCVWQYK